MGIAGLTWLAMHLGLNPLTGGFLYLIMVVLAAAYGGFWSGALTSIIAAMCLDFFFLPPIFHFNVDDPMDWVALGAFQFTSLVISFLQHRAQVKTAEAAAERQGSERLFNAARGILLLEETGNLGNRIAALIQEVFQLRGVMLFDALTAGIHVSGSCPPKVEDAVRGAYFQNSDAYDPATQTRFCVLREGARPVGALGLCGSTIPALAAQAIASLCAITLARARSFEKETRAEGARQAEQLRSAVVEALAHQFKTPLCVILAASSSLLALGELSDSQAELVTAIDGQATKLDDVASRLLGAAALESAQITPRLAPVLLSDAVKEAIRSVEDQTQRERFLVSSESGEVHALADSKLMVTTFTQLVENALKYSIPSSPITIRIIAGVEEVRVRVQNQGAVIAPQDRLRIFERFYRTAEARQASVGTGLGLSIVKRIVDAHRGRVWVESGGEEGTVFIIALPKAPGS